MQESIVIVVVGYAGKLFVDAEVSVERLGHFPQMAETLAEAIKRKVLALTVDGAGDHSKV